MARSEAQQNASERAKAQDAFRKARRIMNRIGDRQATAAELAELARLRKEMQGR